MTTENHKVFNTLKTYLKNKGKDISNDWYVKIETRKSGKSEGSTDNYFFSPNGTRFRSMIEVYRFLTTGDKFERDETTKCLKITEDNTDDIMDDLCELVSDLYINDDITNLRDITSCMFRVEKKKCTNFIEGKLQKTKIQIMDEKFRVTFPKNTDPENISHYSKANAANLVHNFFKTEPTCLGCGNEKSEKCKLTRAHTIKDRPEILDLAISESCTDDGYHSDMILRKFIELHKIYPVSTLCDTCHRIFDNNRKL